MLLRGVVGRRTTAGLVRSLPVYSHVVLGLPLLNSTNVNKYVGCHGGSIWIPTSSRLFHLSSFLSQENKKGPRSTLGSSTTTANSNASAKTEQPQLMIAFTCKKCNTRSSHTMSKQAYTKGTVLIQCPGCKNRHLIADHLKIFSDHSINIEDILKAKGEEVSQSSQDLVLEDIPEKLKPILSKYIEKNKNDEKK